jgi:hypothetical protein
MIKKNLESFGKKYSFQLQEIIDIYKLSKGYQNKKEFFYQNVENIQKENKKF